MDGTFKVLRPEDIGPEMLKAILALGTSTGTWKESDIEYYIENLRGPNNINVVYLENGCVLGHIMARPHNEAVVDYLEDDPLMTPSAVPMYYVDHLNVDSAVSGHRLGLRLILAMASEANQRHVFRFSNHCRTVNGLSRMVQARFKNGVRVVRRIENYSDCNNEPFDYLEVEYNSNSVEV